MSAGTRKRGGAESKLTVQAEVAGVMASPVTLDKVRKMVSEDGVALPASCHPCRTAARLTFEVAQWMRQEDNAGMSNPRDLFQEWRLADHAAHAMEQQVVNASPASSDVDGLASPVADRVTARELRAVANDLLQQVRADIKRRAAAAKQF
jgi:hypothetical protein